MNNTDASHFPFRRCQSPFAILLVTVLVVGSSSSPIQARPPQAVHVVEKGDTIAGIADYYCVSQRDLRELNKLRKGRPLRIGQSLRIPNVLRISGKKYTVKTGDTLSRIAQKHDCSVSEIAHANKLTSNSALKIGQTLVIPDNANQGKSISFTDAKPKPIVFLRVRTGEKRRLKLYYNNGRINKKAVQQLSYLCRDHTTGKVKRLNYRLIELLQRTALEFPDTPIEIISGYREQATGGETQHAFGRAIDFRMPSVSKRRLFRFCKTLPRAGCGMYRQDTFIHMDAREKKASWIH